MAASGMVAAARMAALAMLRDRGKATDEREKREEAEITQLIAHFGADPMGLTVPELKRCLASLAQGQARKMEASFGGRPEIEQAFGLNRVENASASDEEMAYVFLAAGVPLPSRADERGVLVFPERIREVVDIWTAYLWDRPKLKKDFGRVSDGKSTIGASQIRAYLSGLQRPDEEPTREEEVASLLERFVRPFESAEHGLTDVGLYFFARTARRALRNSEPQGWWWVCARRRPSIMTHGLAR
jgi:hypothetical protein